MPGEVSTSRGEPSAGAVWPAGPHSTPGLPVLPAARCPPKGLLILEWGTRIVTVDCGLRALGSVSRVLSMKE